MTGLALSSIREHIKAGHGSREKQNKNWMLYLNVRGKGPLLNSCWQDQNDTRKRQNPFLPSPRFPENFSRWTLHTPYLTDRERQCVNPDVTKQS